MANNSLNVLKAMKKKYENTTTKPVKLKTVKASGIPSAKQINNMLTTYRINDKKAFKDIMTLAESQGIALSSKRKYYSGALPNDKKWISESKKNQKKIEKFWKQVENKYGGSYSNYQKRRRFWYNKYLSNIDAINDTRDGNKIIPLTFENYEKFKDTRDELIDEIYKIAYQIAAEFGDDEVNFTDMRQELDDIFTLGDENLILAKLQEMKEDTQNKYKQLQELEEDEI